MKLEYRQACLVEFARRSTWRSIAGNSIFNGEEPVFGGSGIYFALSHAWVITHGSLLLPHFSQIDDHTKLHEEDYFSERHFRDLIALITLDPKQKLATSVGRHHHSDIFQLTSSEQDGRTELFTGKIKCMWKAKRFSKLGQTLLSPSEGWTFFEEAENNNKTTDAKLVEELLPFFVLIRLDEKPEQQNLLHACSERLVTGDKVHMVGTPFGTMSPSVFLNSVSEGIISNTAGSHQELIVTDARCIPGTEGGPLYLGSVRNSGCLLGVVVSAFCWKENEWIGLSLVCHIREVLRSLAEHEQHGLGEVADLWQPRTSFHGEKRTQHQHIHPTIPPVALVKCRGRWGSGLVIDQKEGLVMTCGHVVKGQGEVQVRIDHLKSEWYDGDVVYATPAGSAFDLGIIRLHGFIPNNKWPNQIEVVKLIHEGDRCYVVGHAVFGQQHNLPASMTSGIICKVLRLHGIHVALQSTCTVNPGASGGPLIDEDGHVFGIVSCNARDEVTGASYPTINLTVPLSTVWPIIKQYIKTKDSQLLKALHVRNQEVENLWNMHGSQRTTVKSNL